MFDRIYNLFSRDVGIDLGTSTTLVYVSGKGIVINEPSIVALNKKTDQVVAIGNEAKKDDRQNSGPYFGNQAVGGRRYF